MATKTGSFNKLLYPNTKNCQTLDAQISRLRDDKDKVYRGLMYGDKKEVNNFLLSKELQFNSMSCSKLLEDKSVYGSIDILDEKFKATEERIVSEVNIKRNVLLVVGGVVILIGLYSFIK
jgi:hypothetical protein